MKNQWKLRIFLEESGGMEEKRWNNHPMLSNVFFLFVLKKKSKRNKCQKARKKNLFAKVEPQG